MTWLGIEFSSPQRSVALRRGNTLAEAMETGGRHTAALGMRFYTGEMFPKDYKNVIFVARHGSWNRTKKLGGDVVAVHLNKDGSVKSVEPFLTGFIGGTLDGRAWPIALEPRLCSNAGHRDAGVRATLKGFDSISPHRD